jgi:hypothetical protein
MNTGMCVVIAETPMPEVPARRVWGVLGGDGLPSLAEHVLDVRTTPQGDQQWSVLLNGSQVDWVQRTVQAGAHELAFELLSGDLAELRGRWTLSPGRLRLTMQFHLGIDGLAPLFDPIWTQSLQAHADALVRAVAGAARSAAEDDDL